MTDRQIRVIIGEMEEFVSTKIAALAANIQAELIEDTPRDTSWAANNWVPAVGAPPPRLSQPTSREGRQRAVAAQRGAQAAATAALLAYHVDRGRVYISNYVPYIGRLNDGSSDQAPSGFVPDAIRRGVRRTV